MSLPFHHQPELLPVGTEHTGSDRATESLLPTVEPARPPVETVEPAPAPVEPAGTPVETVETVETVQPAAPPVEVEPALPPIETVQPAAPQVEIRHSTRRRKTAAARWEGDRVIVLAPHWLRGAELDVMVDHLVGRMLKQRPNLHASDQFLMDRATELADRFLDGVRPASIRWSSRQQMRWGSCTTTTGEIRIAERLRPVPPWVLDSVIVHELAHLLVHEHSAQFRELEARYPRLHDANTFLAGYSMGLRMEAEGVGNL
jgi:predicted metal-dependent hydrolase